PVFGAQARLQPLFVDDAAQAIAQILADPVRHGGQTFELAGPEVLTVEELHRRIAAAQGRDRHFVAVPDGLAGLFAALPGTPQSSVQCKLLMQGSAASGTLLCFYVLGIMPRALGLFLDRWMTRYRKYGRIGDKHDLA